MKELKEENKKEYREKHKNILEANQKQEKNIIKYLKQKYPTVDVESEQLEEMVLQNLIENDFYKNKLGEKTPIIKMFTIKKEEKGLELYSKQEETLKGHIIFVGIELNTSYILVKGSNQLYDELINYIESNSK